MTAVRRPRRDLELDGVAIRVDARPASGAGRGRLEGEALRRGDLVRWLDDDHAELREMRVSVPAAEGSDPASTPRWIGTGKIGR
ncbi:MAG: hypothetical protein ACOC83_09115 [Gemmatimonadota bacterium]